MAWRISCPQCQHEVRTREAGAFVLLCPHCGQASDVEAAEATDAPRSSPAHPWSVFGAGARLLIVGYLIELVTLVLLGLTLIADVRMKTEDRSSYRSALNAVTAILALGFVSSSAFVAWGRTVQLAVPRGNRLRGPLFGAAVGAWLQCLSTFTAVVLVLDTTVGDRWLPQYYSSLWWVFLVSAVLYRWFANMSGLVALGPVSGAMPSRRLASAVSRATIENQLMWAVGTIMVVLVALTQTRLLLAISNTTRANMAAVVIATGFGLLLVSTLVNLSLYSSARRAVAEWKPQTAPGV
jgi:hypothetical protein